MPRRKGGLFLPLDVNFMKDPKVIRARKAHKEAPWLYLAMCLEAKQLGSDGILEGLQVERLHVSPWRKLIAILVDVGLIYEIAPDTWAIAAWLVHNDLVAVVQDRRAADAARKRGTPSVRNPDGDGAEAVGTPSVEKRRVEKRRERVRPEIRPDGSCVHDSDPRLCAFCKHLTEAAS